MKSRQGSADIRHVRALGTRLVAARGPRLLNHEQSHHQHVYLRAEEAIQGLFRTVHDGLVLVDGDVENHGDAGAAVEGRNGPVEEGMGLGITVWGQLVPSTWVTAGTRSCNLGRMGCTFIMKGVLSSTTNQSSMALQSTDGAKPRKAQPVDQVAGASTPAFTSPANKRMIRYPPHSSHGADHTKIRNGPES